MPYFKVSHNGKMLANAGRARIDVLSAHVVVGAQGLASLAVGGMRATRKRQEHFEWISRSLHPGDQVHIAYVATGRGSKPVSRSATEVGNIHSIEEELERLETELGEFESRAGADPAPAAPTWTRAQSPRILRVSTSEQEAIDALLGAEEQLRAVLNLTARGCMLEVDAVTVLQDGSANGKRWLQQELRPGQEVRITYAN